MGFLNYRQYLAVFYICLISTVWTEPIRPLFRRSIFESGHEMYNEDGTYAAITKSTEPRLEVSKLVLTNSGEYKLARSLGGPLAMKWLRQHGNHHPNTTVQWSNGTIVLPHETDALALLHKRWGWQDNFIRLVLFEADAFQVTIAGGVAGFAAFAVVAICSAAWWWGKKGQTEGSKVVTGNSKRHLFGRDSGEPNIYFEQQFTTESNTGTNPDPKDMEYAANDVLQDMADHDFQGACYDGVIAQDPPAGPGFTPIGNTYTSFAHFGVCTWQDGGSCTTPQCEIGLGDEFNDEDGPDYRDADPDDYTPGGP